MHVTKSTKQSQNKDGRRIFRTNDQKSSGLSSKLVSRYLFIERLKLVMVMKDVGQILEQQI